jgi:predicted flavoprotein YhiN
MVSKVAWFHVLEQKIVAVGGDSSPQMGSSKRETETERDKENQRGVQDKIRSSRTRPQ